MNWNVVAIVLAIPATALGVWLLLAAGIIPEGSRELKDGLFEAVRAMVVAAGMLFVWVYVARKVWRALRPWAGRIGGSARQLRFVRAMVALGSVRLLVVLYALVMAWLAVYVPWEREWRGARVSLGYGWLWSPPTRTASVALAQVLLSLVLTTVIFLAVWALLPLLKDRFQSLKARDPRDKE